ncbi:hypothetical protein U1Q18_011701 [Sarracenia purpurea var. burkii]
MGLNKQLPSLNRPSSLRIRKPRRSPFLLPLFIPRHRHRRLQRLWRALLRSPSDPKMIATSFSEGEDLAQKRPRSVLPPRAMEATTLVDRRHVGVGVGEPLVARKFGDL